jgi:hypothetical protein
VSNARQPSVLSIERNPYGAFVIVFVAIKRRTAPSLFTERIAYVLV